MCALNTLCARISVNLSVSCDACLSRYRSFS